MNAFWTDLNEEDHEFKILFMQRIHQLQLFDEIANWFNYEGIE